MRATCRSLLLATVLLSAVNAAPAAAGAACAPMTILTSMEIVPDAAGRPMITALIGDKPTALLVDTGGALSSVTRRVVRELNLQTGASRLQLRNVRGEAENEEARLPSITLGRVRQEGAYFMVLPGSDDPNGPGIEEFGGVLGGDMLRNVDVDLDFAANKLNLISQDHCPGNVVYWQAPSVAVVPITLDRWGHIFFRLQLDGRRLNAALDTGASTTVLNMDIARRTFRVNPDAPDVEKVGELTGGYTANIYRRRFKTLAFEGVTINDPMITLLPDMISGVNPGAPRTGSIIRDERAGLPDLILGMDVLSEMHVYIAYKERKLYITAASPQGGPAPAPAAQ
jgi:predicted aspartyl protease